MTQFLPRGYRVSTENRIKKQIAGGTNWQIYLTNVDTYVLAVKPELYNQWLEYCSLPSGIFENDIAPDLWVFQSTGKYIISSLEDGPFPEEYAQIEAFSLAFKTALDVLDGLDIHGAIYIEEYSFILPVTISKNECDISVVYGKWLTGGINVSINSLDRVSGIMTWTTPEALYRSAKIAGFDVPELSEPVQENKQLSALPMPEKDCSFNCNVTGKKFQLIGRPELEKFFNENIIDIVLNKERYERMGISFPGATILYGPPGSGKTFAVEKLTEFLGWKRFDIDSSTIASSYIHDTSKKISEVFRSAIDAAPSILVIDEMEAFLSNRGMAGPSGLYHVEEVAEFLRRLPEAISKGVLVFAMTNMLDKIDPAILRRGRFDHIIEVKMATADEIEALLLARFKELPVDEAVDAKLIANNLSEHPLSDVAFVLREAGRFAVKRDLDFISVECFSDALDLLPKKKERPRIGFAD